MTWTLWTRPFPQPGLHRVWRAVGTFPTRLAALTAQSGSAEFLIREESRGYPVLPTTTHVWEEEP